MVRKMNRQWSNYLSKALKQLTNGKSLPFAEMTPAKIPEEPGVYLISVKRRESEMPYYVGMSKNLRQRLYRNHLMGPPSSNARLKRYLIDSRQCRSAKHAKEFVREKCSVRWFLERRARRRGAVEAYVTGVVFPKYGIKEEE